MSAERLVAERRGAALTRLTKRNLSATYHAQGCGPHGSMIDRPP
jgi:hypothetical protein